MRAVAAVARSAVRPLAVLVLSAGLAAALAVPATAASGTGLTGSCNPYVAGALSRVPCFAGSESSGSGGKLSVVGASVTNSCAATVLDMAQAQSIGLSWPPPTGHSWALLLCFSGVLGAGPQAILVNSATGVPAVTPQQLLVTAYGELRLPQLTPGTAPPRGHSGLVG